MSLGEIVLLVEGGAGILAGILALVDVLTDSALSKRVVAHLDARRR